MHNPLALLNKELLDNMIQEGNLYYVRQQYPRGITPSDTGIKGAFVLSHYSNKQEAVNHYNVLFEPQVAIYDATIPEDKEKLYIAAGQPAGYKIYALLLEPKEWKPTPELAQKIKQYIRVESRWRLERSDNVKVSLFQELGELFIRLKNGVQEIKVRLSEIEKY